MNQLDINGQDKEISPVETGNASNPSIPNESFVPEGDNQLLDKKAETYLREAGNIEDMPDEGDVQDLDKAVEEAKSEK